MLFLIFIIVFLLLICRDVTRPESFINGGLAIFSLTLALMTFVIAISGGFTSKSYVNTFEIVPMEGKYVKVETTKFPRIIFMIKINGAFSIETINSDVLKFQVGTKPIAEYYCKSKESSYWLFPKKFTETSIDRVVISLPNVEAL